jgi:2-oxo-4-hydroxy-4-carboxy--5-ureidoimidazoline (OHCU) decarboxylase
MVNFEHEKLETAERLTSEDRAGLKKICDEEKAKFEKRLSAWWKRFGSGGIRSWTYCSD